MKKIFLSLVFIISFGLNAVGEQECVLCYEPMMSYQELTQAYSHHFSGYTPHSLQLTLDLINCGSAY